MAIRVLRRPPPPPSSVAFLRVVRWGLLAFVLVVCATNVYILSFCGRDAAAAPQSSSKTKLPGVSLRRGDASLLRAVEDALSGSPAAGERLHAWLSREHAAAAGPQGMVVEDEEEEEEEEEGDFDPTSLYTHQTCYFGSDESELCEYSGAGICWDGEGPVALTAIPMREPTRVTDSTHECSDTRHYEMSSLEWSGCYWDLANARYYTEADVVGHDAGTTHSLPLSRRRWGPQERGVGLIFREIAPWEVFGSGEEAQRRRNAVNARALARLPEVPAGVKGGEGKFEKGRGWVDDDVTGRGVRPAYDEIARRLRGQVDTPAAFVGGSMGGGSSASSLRRLGSDKSLAFISQGSDITGDDILAAVDAPGGGGFAHPTVPRVTLSARYIVDANPPPDSAAHDKSALIAETFRGDRTYLENQTLRLLTPPPRRNVTVEWLDGPLWLFNLGPQYQQNPFHWFSKVGMLWDARRNNATPHFGDHPADGWINWQPDTDLAILRSTFPSLPRVRGGGEGFPIFESGDLEPGEHILPHGALSTRSQSSYRMGGQWGPLPSQDYVMAVCNGVPCGKEVWTYDQFGSWFRETLTLSAQPHARTVFGELADGYSKDHLLCARRGVVLGTKHRFFTGRADANVFRNYAYVLSSVPPPVGAEGSPLLGSYPHFPPRTITIINRRRSNREILNIDAVIAMVKNTGLTVEVVSGGDMAEMIFGEQVRLMARTGILITAHGAVLANTIFLPAHAVVIELFPWGMKKMTYAAIAHAASVLYTPIFSRERLPTDSPEASMLYSRYYHEKCVMTNISTFDAVTEHACNQASKLHPVIVPMDTFGHELTNALDSIGAFSLLNPEWAAIAQSSGMSPPTYEEWVRGRPQELIDQQGDLLAAGG